MKDTLVDLLQVLVLVGIMIVMLCLSGCSSINIPSTPKQDQVMLVVPSELLEPVQPIGPIKEKRK